MRSCRGPGVPSARRRTVRGRIGAAAVRGVIGTTAFPGACARFHKLAPSCDRNGELRESSVFEERNQTFSRRRTNSNLYHADAGIASFRDDAADAPRPHTCDSERGLCLVGGPFSDRNQQSAGGLGVEQHDADRGSGRSPRCRPSLQSVPGCSPSRPTGSALQSLATPSNSGTSAPRISSVTPLARGHLGAVARQAESGDVRAGVDLRGREGRERLGGRPIQRAHRLDRRLRRPPDRSGRT